MIPEEILEDVEEAVAEIMKKECVNHFKYVIEGKSEAGDNYMGEIIFLSVQPEGEKERTYNLVIKTAKRSRDLRDNFPIEIFYNRELFMYSDVFPSYQKFIQEVKPDFKFNFISKVYWLKKELGKETIVMENLKSQKFDIYNRKKPWNMQHSLLVMKQYGKLHALSIALRDQKPEIFQNLKENLGDVIHGFTDKVDMKLLYEKPFEHVMGLLKKIGREDLVKKYDGVFKEGIDVVTNKIEVESEMTALCHMDCWNNNFMFEYENGDETNPLGVRFLDFQLSVLDSPTKDLSYNIYATCDKSNLVHFDELLQTYYNSLTHCLRSLGSDPSKFFNINDLRRHWRIYGLYGLFYSINLIKIQLLEKENAPTMEDMVKDDNMLEGFNVKITDQEEYDRRILDVFVHFGDEFL